MKFKSFAQIEKRAEKFWDEKDEIGRVSRRWLIDTLTKLPDNKFVFDEVKETTEDSELRAFLEGTELFVGYTIGELAEGGSLKYTKVKAVYLDEDGYIRLDTDWKKDYFLSEASYADHTDIPEYIVASYVSDILTWND